MSISRIEQHFTEAKKALESFMQDQNNYRAIAEAGDLMAEAIKKGNKVISCGNGGSMCDAMHFAEELSGRYRNDRKALAAISISDPSHITCTGNDMGFEMIFSRYIEALGRPGDVLLAISTSGNSGNVLKAVETARQMGIHVVGLTGKDGGKMSGNCSVEIRAPHFPYADRAQEIHIKIIHALIDHIEQSVF